MSAESLPETNGYGRGTVFGAVVVGLVVAYLTIWWASGNAVFYEELFRIAPTVEGGGVGTDWQVGNTIVPLDFLIALTHAADVIMGVFVLFLLFVHWSIFRQFASRMRQPGESRGQAAMADGGDERGGDRP